MTDPRIAVLAAMSRPDWHPVSEAHGMPWGEAEALLAAYDASRDGASVPSVPADTDLRERMARALAEVTVGHKAFVTVDVQAEYPRADAALAVLPAFADRAAVLREAADVAYRIARRLNDQHHDERAQGAWDVENTLRAELRRMADGAQQAGAGDRIVARRSPATSSVYCTTHGTPEMTPLTSDDLPDGAHCQICGTDVLIPQKAEGR